MYLQTLHVKSIVALKYIDIQCYICEEEGKFIPTVCNYSFRYWLKIANDVKEIGLCCCKVRPDEFHSSHDIREPKIKPSTAFIFIPYDKTYRKGVQNTKLVKDIIQIYILTFSFIVIKAMG